MSTKQDHHPDNYGSQVEGKIYIPINQIIVVAAFTHLTRNIHAHIHLKKTRLQIQSYKQSVNHPRFRHSDSRVPVPPKLASLLSRVTGTFLSLALSLN